RIDDAAEQAFAHRHVDDFAEALDGVAFLQAAVFAENNDADIVAFEVQRHALHAARKLDHFPGLHVLEAVDARDAVADRENAADLGNLGLSTETFDLLFQDRGNFSGADVHSSTP